MASERQVKTARQNVKQAQQAARRKRTIANLPRSTRRSLYDIAKKRDIPGRSKMGKWDLIEAIRRSR